MLPIQMVFLGLIDEASIIAGRKTIKGTMSAIKSAYEKIKSWF